MGRAWLCALPERARRPVLDEIRASDPAEWPGVKKRIEQALREYAEKGYCLGLGDWRREIHAIAAPLVPEDGSETLVFSCSGAAFQLGREKLERDVGPRLLSLVGNVASALAHPIR